ncbi:hypothetical protein GCM10011339_33640 [Echinicola rosea]|uniref:Uncharacterized protein n=2 Tax=Echinicola rosea TaxID=1807691 RepID=A0ABQ1V7A3_9BACT|nr:hypothetical protein GCM10011339_33640 [Echinicola rosea]
MENTANLIDRKNNMVAELMGRIRATENPLEKPVIIASLVRNFRDERIFPFLCEMLNDRDQVEIHGFLIGACSEYSLETCRDKMSFFLDLLANGTYEASLAAAGLLLHLMDTYKLDGDTLDKLNQNISRHLDPVSMDRSLRHDLNDINGG